LSLQVGGSDTVAIVADLHMHSTNSFDGKNSMYEMCAAAVKLGMKHVCFTEHYDFNPTSRSYRFFVREKYNQDIEQCREAFGDSLEILTGIEFGEPHKYPAEFEKVHDAGFDVVLGAVHRIGDVPVAVAAATDMPAEEIFQRYYEEVLAAVKLGGFDVLAHMDLPKRHVGSSRAFPSITEEIFWELRKRDIVPEINTSTYRSKATECSPDLPLLQQWKWVGGEKLVIGSDAHSVGAIGQAFERAENLVRETQLSYGLFRNRRYHKLG